MAFISSRGTHPRRWLAAQAARCRPRFIVPRSAACTAPPRPAPPLYPNTDAFQASCLLAPPSCPPAPPPQRSRGAASATAAAMPLPHPHPAAPLATSLPPHTHTTPPAPPKLKHPLTLDRRLHPIPPLRRSVPIFLTRFMPAVRLSRPQLAAVPWHHLLPCTLLPTPTATRFWPRAGAPAPVPPGGGPVHTALTRSHALLCPSHPSHPTLPPPPPTPPTPPLNRPPTPSSAPFLFEYPLPCVRGERTHVPCFSACVPFFRSLLPDSGSLTGVPAGWRRACNLVLGLDSVAVPSLFAC